MVNTMPILNMKKFSYIMIKTFITLFLLIGLFTGEANAIKTWDKPRKRTLSPVYWLIEKYGFDVDKFMRQRDESPLYFKNCELISDERVKAFSHVGIGTCLYLGLKYKQFDSSKRNNSYIRTTIHLKESGQQVNAVVHWTPPKFLKSIKTIKDDIFLHDITVELEHPVHYEDLYPVGLLFNIHSNITDDTIGQIKIQKLTLKAFKSKTDPDFKVLVLSAFSKLETDELILSGILHMDYTLFDEEYFIKLTGEIFWDQ